jgi:hypothetical protein
MGHDNQVYKNIARFDAGIADRWWSVTGGNVKVGIDAASMERIVGNLSSLVTPGQSGAIDQLIRWHDNWIGDAFDRLNAKFTRAVNTGAIWRGSSHRLNGPQSGALPDDIIDSFRLIGHVDFTSPMSKWHYTPSQYMAVLDLIRKRYIYLYEVEDHGLTLRGGGPLGYYDKRGDPRMLVLNQVRYGNSGRQRNLVHESTHAIQDWAKVPGLIGKHAEADAHVCGWVIGRLLGETTMAGLDTDIAITAFDVADFVIKKTTDSKRADFLTAYKALVDFIEKEPAYAADANKGFAESEPEDIAQKQVFADSLARKP